MAEYLPFSTQEQSYTAGGLDARDPTMTGVNFSNLIADQARKQQTQAMQVAEAVERVKQAKLQSTQKQAAADLGINAETEGYMSVQQAVAAFHANGLKQEQIDAFIADMGDNKMVPKSVVQSIILKRGGSQLNLGVQKVRPLTDSYPGEDGKPVLAWGRQTVDENGKPKMEITTRRNASGPVFEADDAEGYATGQETPATKIGIAQMVANARKLSADVGRERLTEQSWQKLQDKVNVSNAPAARAIGQAAVNNMRADRALKLLNKEALTKNEYDVVVSDLAAIFKGGVPDVLSLEHQRYATLQSDVNEVIQYVTSAPSEVNTPEIKDRLRGITNEVKQIDNGIILNYMDSVAAGYETYIAGNPERFARMVNAQLRNLGADTIDTSVIEGMKEMPLSESVTKKNPELTGKPDTETATEDKKAALRKKLGI